MASKKKRNHLDLQEKKITVEQKSFQRDWLEKEKKTCFKLTAK